VRDAVLPARRRWTGALAAASGPAVLTAALIPARDTLSLASQALLFLPIVVASAAIGGAWPGLLAAAVSDLLLNWYFIPPYHTFVVDHRDNLIALIVYIAVAAAVALIVELAARHRANAERTRTEVRLLARATTRPIAEQSLTALLELVRDTFAMTTVAVLNDGVQIERVGPPPAGDPVVDIPGSDQVRLTAHGPPTIGHDHRLLGQLAGAAARILEARTLTDQAAHARQLAEIDRLRAALLAAVGHDLRTPLAGIKAAITSLRDPTITWTDTDRDDLHATIEESADTLDDLVNNLLDMSRLQAGVLSVHLTPTPVQAACAKAALTTTSTTATVDTDAPDDLFAHADPGLLDRVLANLLDNATRFSPTVTITARRDGKQVHIAVTDHGPGIPATGRDRIFEPFQRLDDTTHTGPGLGLAIARGFTTAMHGTLIPTDTPDGGLTMTITLPAA
jgi:K+-sensing histidine kinase KdpD